MAKKVVRVNFVDSSSKAFAIDVNANSHQLRDLIVERIGLKEDSCFALFERNGEWERCLDLDERPADLMEQWEKQDKKKEGENSFLFKKKIFLKDDNGEMDDPVAKDLVYKQAVYNVVSSDYPCSLDEAITLAALQMQVVYGDYNTTIHTNGFLVDHSQWKQFIPKTYHGQKKPTEWETLIYREYAKLLKKSAEDAKSDYLTVVKDWQFYGTTFFPPCKSTNRNLTGKVIIGVNYEGIRLLKSKNKELISEHLFTEICSWASSNNSFAFEFGNQTESQKYTFETRQGAIIASTIQTYIDILVQMLKNGDDENDDESEQTTTSQLSDF